MPITSQKKVGFEIDFALDPSLVLYLPLYKLDGASFASRDGYGHLATVTGALWTPQGRTFDGSDDVITVPNHPAFAWGTGNFTLMIWIRPDGTAQTHLIMAKDDYTGESPVGESKWCWRILAGGSSNAYIAGNEIHNYVGGYNDDEWHCLAATREGTGGWLYEDGRNTRNGFAWGSYSLSTDVDLRIGHKNVDVGKLKGYMGEVLIYNRALSAPKIQSIYLATKWRYV